MTSTVAEGRFVRVEFSEEPAPADLGFVIAAPGRWACGVNPIGGLCGRGCDHHVVDGRYLAGTRARLTAPFEKD